MTADASSSTESPTTSASPHNGKNSTATDLPVFSEPEDLDEPDSKIIGGIQNSFRSFGKRHEKLLRWSFYALVILAVHVYVVCAAVHDLRGATGLIVVTILAWIVAYYNLIYEPYLKSCIRFNVGMCSNCFRPAMRSAKSRQFSGAVVALSIVAFLAWDSWEDRSRLVGLGGMAAFVAFMWIASNNRSKIRWRPVIVGFLLQFVVGLLVLRWHAGSEAFGWLCDRIVAFLEYTNAGTEFVYGFLAKPPAICGMSGVFAFTVLQVLIFFSSVVSLLYYFGVMQFVLKHMAAIVQRTMSLNACACVFLGLSEAPLLIQPYLSRMTASELHAVMSSGFSCIAGSLFAAYISFGVCPKYLLSSTVMSAPASLACAKILFPETEESQLERVEDLELPESKERSPIECISNGAVAAIHLVGAIIANLIVFMALLAFFDDVIGYVGERIGASGWNLQLILGYLFFPMAYVMGVTDPEQTLRVAQLMGTKTAVNEFIAYQKMGVLLEAGLLAPRSATIATYALCGFSNFCSIGIAIGVLGSLAPDRKRLISKIALRALLAGSISCFYTAALAGVLISSPISCPVRLGNSECFNASHYAALISSSTPSPNVAHTPDTTTILAVTNTEL